MIPPLTNLEKLHIAQEQRRRNALPLYFGSCYWACYTEDKEKPDFRTAYWQRYWQEHHGNL